MKRPGPRVAETRGTGRGRRWHGRAGPEGHDGARPEPCGAAAKVGVVVVTGVQRSAAGQQPTRRERLKAVGFVSSVRATRRDDLELESQALALRRACAARGWELTSMVHEVGHVRLRGTARPSVADAVSRLARREASCLLVAEVDRLCRSVDELAAIVEAVARTGGRLVVLEPEIDTGTVAGRAMTPVLVAIGDWERAQRAARSRTAMEAARARGAGLATIDTALKRHIVRMRRAGMTLQAIADELNAQCVPTVRGGALWRPSSVQAAIGYRRPPRA
jgi:DNA invertase Pin-like site-specific DNA recombinase